MKTWEECLKEGIQNLTEQNIDNACGDAWALFSFVTGWSRADYVMEQNKPMEEKQQKYYMELIARRSSHEPLQYITGVQNFYGYDFQVSPSVLIPRYDTEVLIEKIMQLKPTPNRVLDLCTGSGCIAVTLAKEIPLSLCAAVDISEEALQVAQENAKQLEAEVTFLQGDLYRPIEEKKLGSFDLIVSNPPYIPTEVCESLMEEVRDHEPRLALDGKEDGLHFYRRIIKDAGRYLNPGGFLALEIGSDQGKDIREMLQSHGFQNVQIHKDLAGLERVACGRWMGDRKQ